jgi:hypothetical protein
MYTMPDRKNPICSGKTPFSARGFFLSGSGKSPWQKRITTHFNVIYFFSNIKPLVLYHSILSFQKKQKNDQINSS